MRKIVLEEFLSLDGVAQAPGFPDEDRDGGFAHGGWHMPFIDEAAQEFILRSIREAGAFLLGRRTYQLFAGYWPNASGEEQVIAEQLNTKPKHVASRTLSEPLEWQNSSLLGGDVADAVRKLKQQDGGDIHVIGSTQLVATLFEHDLVDELRLMIDPILLGGGKGIFRDDGVQRKLRLVDGEVTSSGAVIATYARADD